MLYTRKGDTGTSGLFGTAKRLSKDSPIYTALGTLDELNSLLGLCRAHVGEKRGEKLDISKEVLNVQEVLFIAQAECAGADKHVTQANIDALEKVIGILEDSFPNPRAFVIPGATELPAWFDYARTVCRRAERESLQAARTRPVNPLVHVYLNRLSDLLFILARAANVDGDEPLWVPGGSR